MFKQLQTGFFYLLFPALLLTGFHTAHAQTEIFDWNDLNNVRQNLTGNYLLMSDLDEETAGYSTFNTGEGWMPIGDTDNRFAGTFNGNGHTISGLTIDRGTGNNGLFGATLDATIENVGLLNVSVRAGAGNNGALAGNLIRTNVSNAYATGTVTSTTSANTANFAGLLGRYQGGLVTDSWASVDVDSGPMCNNVGGLIGYLVNDAERPAQLRNSFATGNVIGNRDRAAGLVGASNGSILDSYARGNVSGSSDRVAGLVGWNLADQVINRSYSTGTVEGAANLGIGGLVAFNEGDVISSYWDTEASGMSESAGGDGKTTAEMKTQATFAGWDFSLLWVLNESVNDGYPSFLYQSPPAEPVFARVQIIHNAADPAAEVVDIYVNGDLFVGELAFREATPYVDVPADTPLLIEIYGHGANPSETDAVFILNGAEFAEDGTYAVIANGVLADGFAANPDDVETAFNLFVLPARESHDNSEEAAFYIWHGSTDAPAVDVFARDVAQLADGLVYTNATDYIVVSAAEYTVDLTPAGVSDVVASFVAPLEGSGGAALGVLASGFFNPAGNNDGPAFGLLAVFSDGFTVLLPAAATSSEPLVDLPKTFRLEQNYPNPFNPTTQIEFTLPETANVTLEVFNLQGQRVATLVDGNRPAGVHTVSFDATNMASGVYLYRIQAGDFTKVNKMTLLK